MNSFLYFLYLGSCMIVTFFVAVFIKFYIIDGIRMQAVLFRGRKILIKTVWKGEHPSYLHRLWFTFRFAIFITFCKYKTLAEIITEVLKIDDKNKKDEKEKTNA